MIEFNILRTKIILQALGNGATRSIAFVIYQHLGTTDRAGHKRTRGSKQMVFGKGLVTTLKDLEESMTKLPTGTVGDVFMKLNTEIKKKIFYVFCKPKANFH
jgi:hypothetical protein